ncbi:MAG: hypothetical protein AB1553_10835 [Nitrospirota bacterium]
MTCFAVLFFALSLLLPKYSAAFEVKGLQPLSPYGVFSTFSAESLKQNKVGFGVGLEKSSDPDFYRTLFQFAYGLHDRFEINITLPYVIEWEDRVDGLEDLHIGIKHRIIDEGEVIPAVAYMLTVSPPSGKDEFTIDGGVGGGVVLTKKVGPFKGHINGLYSRPEKRGLREEYTLNIGTELAVSHNSKVLAELVGKKNFTRNKIDLLEWRLGYRIVTADNIFTTIGAGFDIKNRTPDFRLIFSLSIILPKEKKKYQKIYE